MYICTCVVYVFCITRHYSDYFVTTRRIPKSTDVYWMNVFESIGTTRLIPELQTRLVSVGYRNMRVVLVITRQKSAESGHIPVTGICRGMPIGVFICSCVCVGIITCAVWNTMCDIRVQVFTKTWYNFIAFLISNFSIIDHLSQFFHVEYDSSIENECKYM